MMMDIVDKGYPRGLAHRKEVRRGVGPVVVLQGKAGPYRRGKPADDPGEPLKGGGLIAVAPAAVNRNHIASEKLRRLRLIGELGKSPLDDIRVGGGEYIELIGMEACADSERCGPSAAVLPQGGEYIGFGKFGKGVPRLGMGVEGKQLTVYPEVTYSVSGAVLESGGQSAQIVPAQLREPLQPRRPVGQRHEHLCRGAAELDRLFPKDAAEA